MQNGMKYNGEQGSREQKTRGLGGLLFTRGKREAVGFPAFRMPARMILGGVRL